MWQLVCRGLVASGLEVCQQLLWGLGGSWLDSVHLRISQQELWWVAAHCYCMVTGSVPGGHHMVWLVTSWALHEGAGGGREVAVKALMGGSTPPVS
jgi:hypothetical protein